MVTLTLLTFFVGVLADYVIQRKRKSGAVANEIAPPAAVLPVEAESSPAYVEGFLVLEGLRYHSGHTWGVNSSTRLASAWMSSGPS